MALFDEKAPVIMRKLMADFRLSVEDAAAILGNIGHECAGFLLMQEQRPTVKGSRGGWGWCQWTGPRRKAAEAYWSRHGYDPAGDTANYKWLFLELKGAEGRRALPALQLAKTLPGKAVAFERAFLRAGIKHDASRIAWAKRALAAYQATPSPTPKPTGFVAWFKSLFSRG
jgi:hypothetical protein